MSSSDTFRAILDRLQTQNGKHDIIGGPNILDFAAQFIKHEPMLFMLANSSEATETPKKGVHLHAMILPERLEYQDRYEFTIVGQLINDGCNLPVRQLVRVTYQLNHQAFNNTELALRCGNIELLHKL